MVIVRSIHASETHGNLERVRGSPFRNETMLMQGITIILRDVAQTQNSMGNRFGKLCKGIVSLDEIKLSHERLLNQKDLHLQDLQLTVRHLYNCIVMISAIAAFIVVCVIISTVFLLRIKDEQKRRLESQNNKYEGIIQEKTNRIQELEKEKQASGHGVMQHIPQQQPFVYAFPGLPPPIK